MENAALKIKTIQKAKKKVILFKNLKIKFIKIKNGRKNRGILPFSRKRSYLLKVEFLRSATRANAIFLFDIIS